nr:unnamed protein product [Callosobruchus chinensis]
MDTRFVLVFLVVLCVAVPGAFGAGRYVPKWKKQAGQEICATYRSADQVVTLCRVTAIDLENVCASWDIMVIDVTGAYRYQAVNMVTAMRAFNASVTKVGMDSSALSVSIIFSHSTQPTIVIDVAGAKSAGGGKTVRNATLIPVAFMVPAEDPGSATVRRVGEECFAMKTMRPYITSAPTTPSNTTESSLGHTSTGSVDRENTTTTTLKPTTEALEEKPSDNET